MVCSRIAEYETLTARLRLPGAIVIQPLTRAQVGDFLDRASSSLDWLRTALRDDPTLWELFDTPLMLSIAALACQGSQQVDILGAGTLAERREHLFARYIDSMFRRRVKESRYSREQTIQWLVWLASSMARLSQSVFYLESLDQRWMAMPGQQRAAVCHALLQHWMAILRGRVF